MNTTGEPRNPINTPEELFLVPGHPAQFASVGRIMLKPCFVEGSMHVFGFSRACNQVFLWCIEANASIFGMKNMSPRSNLWPIHWLWRRCQVWEDVAITVAQPSVCILHVVLNQHVLLRRLLRSVELSLVLKRLYIWSSQIHVEVEDNNIDLHLRALLILIVERSLPRNRIVVPSSFQCPVCLTRKTCWSVWHTSGLCGVFRTQLSHPRTQGWWLSILCDVDMPIWV